MNGWDIIVEGRPDLRNGYDDWHTNGEQSLRRMAPVTSDKCSDNAWPSDGCILSEDNHKLKEYVSLIKIAIYLKKTSIYIHG